MSPPDIIHGMADIEPGLPDFRSRGGNGAM
jgi:hypothetical protein